MATIFPLKNFNSKLLLARIVSSLAYIPPLAPIFLFLSRRSSLSSHSRQASLVVALWALWGLLSRLPDLGPGFIFTVGFWILTLISLTGGVSALAGVQDVLGLKKLSDGFFGLTALEKS